MFSQDQFQAKTHLICAELERLLDRSQAPEDIRAFLLEQWARLLAVISLERGEQHPDWLAGWDTVQALLWSLEPKQGLPDTEQLLGMLPLLLERLQDGCKALKCSPEYNDVFFSHLAMLHAAVVREGLQSARSIKPGAAETSQALPPGPAKDMAVAEEAALAAPADGAGAGDPETRGQLLAMEVGDRMIFVVDGEAKILSLQWISPMQGMFLFADDQGLDALSLTRARLAYKLQRGEARWSGKDPAAQS